MGSYKKIVDQFDRNVTAVTVSFGLNRVCLIWLYRYAELVLFKNNSKDDRIVIAGFKRTIYLNKNYRIFKLNNYLILKLGLHFHYLLLLYA